jgi:hypothetical protein
VPWPPGKEKVSFDPALGVCSCCVGVMSVGSGNAAPWPAESGVRKDPQPRPGGAALGPGTVLPGGRIGLTTPGLPGAAVGPPASGGVEGMAAPWEPPMSARREKRCSGLGSDTGC